MLSREKGRQSEYRHRHHNSVVERHTRPFPAVGLGDATLTAARSVTAVAAVAAVETGRRFVGYDTNATYVALARRRVREAKARVGGAVVKRGPTSARSGQAAQAANGQGQNGSAPAKSKDSSPRTSKTKS